MNGSEVLILYPARMYGIHHVKEISLSDLVFLADVRDKETQCVAVWKSSYKSDFATFRKVLELT